MDGERKIINGIFPITTTKAVYIDGTNKTLQEAIEDGDLSNSTQVSTTSDFIVDAFLLVNDVTFSKDYATNDITIYLNKSLTLNRLLKVCWANRGPSTIGFPDGTVIPNNMGLYWNPDEGFTTASYNGSDIQARFNRILIGLNWNGRITAGLLAPLWEKYYPYKYPYNLYKQRYIRMEEIKTSVKKTLHSMVAIGDELWTFECVSADFGGNCEIYSLPDMTHKSTFYQHITPPRTTAEGNINLRLVCADYNKEHDCLLFGSGTADGSDWNNMEAYIFYNASTTLKTFTDKSNPFTLDNTSNTIIDFHKDGLFPEGSITAKLVWSELPDVIYLTHNDLSYCHKILLGVGTNQLEYGTYNYDETKRYNGTFKIIQTFTQGKPAQGNKDVVYYNGYLYYPIKYVAGGYRLMKTTLNVDGSMSSEMLVYDPVKNDGSHAIGGSPEGITVYNGKIICAHADPGSFYRFDANI